MTRDPDPELDEEPPEPEPRGTVGTTPPGVLVGLFLAGLVAGRLVRPVSIALDRAAPRVGWLPVFALFFVAAILISVAWLTHRTLHQRGGWLQPHEAVNRLVLAKSCAIAGALLAGGYFGYALGWLGDHGALTRERILQPAMGGVAAVLIVAGSLALERACRVRGGEK